MADYIDREELLKEEQIFQQYNSAIKDDDYIRAVTVADIEAMPSVDAVEVVRCKDCKYRHKDFCLRLGKLDEEQNSYFLIVKDTDYCKWGEKE